MCAYVSVVGDRWVVEVVEGLGIPVRGETGMGYTWVMIWASVALSAVHSSRGGG